MKVIICTGRDGQALVYGETDSNKLSMPGEDVRIKSARMILYYSGGAGLFGLAEHGPQEGSRITTAVSETTCTVRQALAVSDKAAESIERWPDAE